MFSVSTDGSKQQAKLIQRRNTKDSGSQTTRIHQNANCDKRKKAAMMLLTLVIVFFITNLPVHLFNILMYV